MEPREHRMFSSLVFLLTILCACTTAPCQLKAPPGLFKDLNDEIVGDAIILRGTQLFIDNHIIESLAHAEKVLNQPVKHPRNPVLVRDKPWEESGPGYGTVIYDKQEQLFKMWYQLWRKVKEPAMSAGLLCYATSKNGIDWNKTIIDEKDGTNIVEHPAVQGFQAAGIFKDPIEANPAKRYKMLFSCNPDGTAKSWMTSAGYSADGIHWKAHPETALIPFSDTQICPFWDRRQQRYVAILRFGPPNTRIVSRTESEDFLHWSPKVTVLRRAKLDVPLRTQFYQMAPMTYGDVYVGLIAAYHSETLKPLPPDKPWTDRKNLQLVFSRNGLTWSRVGRHGAISQSDLQKDRDWQRIAVEAVFLPYGKKDKEWDWGTVSPYFTPEPIVRGDEIWFYYMAQNGRNWWNYKGDPPKRDPNATEPRKGVGLATLRIDGFVSINADERGTLTTKPLMFLGDTLELNANAKQGSIVVEALDVEGRVIDGFSKQACVPLTSDSVRHVVRWKGQKDCHLIQARPLKLRFHLENAKLYSFTPRIRHKHYAPSY